MKPERLQRSDEILQAALELASEDRAAFLDQACAGDAALRQKIESLLASAQQMGGFMEECMSRVAGELLADEPATAATGQMIGYYKIVELLDKGGMGEVYLAIDTRTGREVALKLLPAFSVSDQQRVRRFQQEARSILALNHPNIVTIYEIGQTDTAHYIVTERISGETLRRRLARAPLEIPEALAIAIEVAKALEATHAAGIVHRDIKPENIMLRPDGYVKVLDFGIAKLTERQAPIISTEAATMMKIHTAPGVVMGTVYYMSPEQARGQEVDARTDIWSLGVVLYEMVAGRPPFKSETPNDVIALILQRGKEPLPLARSTPEAPPELQRIITKALQKERDKRYQTIKDLRLDLENLKQEEEFEAKLQQSVSPEPGSTTTGLPSSARTASSAEYSARGIRQHKLSVIIALAALLMSSAAIATYFYVTRSDSLAVMPFTYVNTDPNVMADPDREYLSDGITESIINHLSQLPNLRVIPRSTVFHYKGKEADPQPVGHELGVRTVLIGRIIQRGDNLTVRTELVDVENNRQLWGEQYDRKVSDLLALQTEISEEISNKLRLRWLTKTERQQITRNYTENTEAYQLYLKGRYYWNKRTSEGLSKAAVFFEQAIEKDPNYALAYSGLADSYSVPQNPIAPRDRMPKAKAAAMKAIELDDTLAEAHASLGNVKHIYDWDFAGAEKEFKRAIELNSNYTSAHHFYALLLASLGRWQEANDQIKRALELEPFSLIINSSAGRILYLEREYDQAIEQLRKALELDPNFARAHFFLGQVYQQKGLNEQAVAEFQKALQLDVNQYLLAGLGYAYATSGKRDEAMKVLDQLKDLSKQRYASSYGVAIIHLGLGEKDAAFESLEKAYQERSEGLSSLMVEPRWDSLRADPRFADLMRRVGLGP
ncbi:MAG TPA: protein kinase [Pyrinomonadaceae bacterium]|nr:protein kinase [Pyrinomonadaceae bacterium]